MGQGPIVTILNSKVFWKKKKKKVCLEPQKSFSKFVAKCFWQSLPRVSMKPSTDFNPFTVSVPMLLVMYVIDYGVLPQTSWPVLASRGI